VLNGLEVREDNMARNLDLLGGLLLSERLMLALGEQIGKQTAHDLVYAIAMQAQEEGVPFKTALLADARITSRVDRVRLDRLLDPRSYIGLAPQVVETVVGRAGHGGEPEP
jgi:adenylosuccinate lyase